MAIDHFGIEVPSDALDETVSAYLAALRPIGYKEIMRFTKDEATVVGLGVYGPDFWIVSCTTFPDSASWVQKPIHYAFSAPTRKSIHAAYDAAIQTGFFTDNGKPGRRPEYTRFYYAAYFKDRHGNRVEVVSHMPGSVDAVKTFVTSGLGLSALGAVGAAAGYYFTKA